MQGNRSTDTKPELQVRRLLHRRGLRYRKHVRPLRDLRCVADVVFTRRRIAVFIDGCFWHGCREHGHVPRTNSGYWSAKLQRNERRDREVTAALEAAGWTVLRFWEHDPADGSPFLTQKGRRLVAAGTRWFVLGATLAAIAAGAIADVAWTRASDWFGNHQFVTALFVEGLLLVLTYVAIDRILGRRESQRLERLWRDAAQPTLTELLEIGWRVDAAAIGIAGHLRDRSDGPEVFQRAQEDLRRLLEYYASRVERSVPIFMSAPELAQFVRLAWDVRDTGWRLATSFRELLSSDDYDSFRRAFLTLGKRAGDEMQPLPRFPLGLQMQMARERQRFERTMRAWSDLPPM